MATKAVHLEVVSDMTTQGFIAALRRFTGRKGVPQHIYSDNGTNFVGASNELKELQEMFLSEQENHHIHDTLSQGNIQFHFIPPHAPNQGGIWEAVQSNHLNTISNALLVNPFLPSRNFTHSLPKLNPFLTPDQFPECPMTPVICHILPLVISLLAKHLQIYLILT